MFENPNFSEFNIFFPCRPLKSKIPNLLKIFFKHLNLIIPYSISSSWDNLEPRYAWKHIFEVCPQKEERCTFSQNPVSVGAGASKPKSVTQSSIESPETCSVKREWVDHFFKLSPFIPLFSEKVLKKLKLFNL